jgi:succinyl-diaminopimelate desuccinylase
MIRDCVEFLRRLIRTPSPPGEEGAVADLVVEEMRRLGYDEVRTDEAGNVIGLVRGEAREPSLMLNTHLDHVDPGDPDAWPFPPYSGQLDGGRVWGRGAVDIKGPLAAQVYAAGGLAAEGRRPPGDLYVTAVVQEEVGGLGAAHLARELRTDLVIVGEPSGNALRRGHRGRAEIEVCFIGRSAHASVPHLAVNPLETAAGFLGSLDRIPRAEHPELGVSTLVPTLIRTDQASSNVIPARVWLTLDWRSVPGEDPDAMRRDLERLGGEAPVEGGRVEVRLRELELRTYSGLIRRLPAAHPPFLVPAEDLTVRAAERVLGEALGRSEPAGIWRFATDGGHFAQAGMRVLGFGPGDDALAHTVEESIAVAELEEAVTAYRALALARWDEA